VIPDFDQLEERVDYLMEIGIPEDKIAALIKKVPEVLGRGLHSFPFPLNLSLLCPFPLNLSLLCPAYDSN